MALDLEDRTVLCIVCLQPHATHPEARYGKHRGEEGHWGVFAEDYTYYKDAYKGAVGPICKEHNRDDISVTKEEDLYIK